MSTTRRVKFRASSRRTNSNSSLQRRNTRSSLLASPINEHIVERHYQHRAIRQIAEAFEVDHDRKALLVMATGAGKTRTVIALSDLLMRNNWVKRVLFLADRNALVKQAVNAFKEHLPHSSPVNLVAERDAEGRVFVSTYQTMMGLIEDFSGESRRFGPGHFDLVVIDEAHRSVFKKYKAIFEYFDSLLVGLTATPKAGYRSQHVRPLRSRNGSADGCLQLGRGSRGWFPRSASGASRHRSGSL